MRKESIELTFVIVGVNLLIQFLYCSLAWMQNESLQFTLFAFAIIIHTAGCFVCSLVFAVQNKTYIAIGFVLSILMTLLLGGGFCALIW